MLNIFGYGNVSYVFNVLSAEAQIEYALQI